MKVDSYQPFNDLGVSQYRTLKDDIELHGVLIPILVDEDGKTIDGHQRRRICAELHIECPSETIAGLTEDEKRSLAFTLNLYRRHLDPKERAAAVGRLAQLGWSTRRIADFLQTPKSSVHRDVQQLSQVGQLDRPDTTEGLDGRHRPSTRPPSAPAEPPPGVDTETGEVLGGDDREGPEVPDDASAPSTSPESGGDGTGRGASSATGNGTAPPDSVPVDEGDAYREAVSTAIVKARGLLKLDPERVVATRPKSDHDSLVIFLDDFDAWTSSVRQHLESIYELKAVHS